MRGPTYRFFTVAVLCAGFFAGCEWTGSDSESSWSGSYDDMNFSGTYFTGAVNEETIGSSEKRITGVKIAGYSQGEDSYSGTLAHGDIVPGSLGIKAGQFSYKDDGEGDLIGNNPSISGNGAIIYPSGFWSFTLGSGSFNKASGDITASYTYVETTSSAANELTSLTVSQTGQNLTIRLSNGVTMSGKFTTVNESGGGEGGTAHNAGFEVSSSGNKFVGTLNSGSGKRVISGTWISGKSNYTINGTAN